MTNVLPIPLVHSKSLSFCIPNEKQQQYNTMQWGVKEIHVLSVLASSKGLSELLKYHPDVHVTVGHIDDKLNDDGDIVPGLGDAGDRLFGTPLESSRLYCFIL